MQTYLIFHRGAWESEAEVDDAFAFSSRVEDEEMRDQLRGIRYYVIEEEDGTLGAVGVFQAADEDVLLEHAQKAELPADEVVPVIDTVLIRDDP
jgi:hypothetical protein